MTFIQESESMKRASKAGALLVTASLLVVWGCNSEGPPPVSGSTEESAVKGTVTLKGQPLTKGTVTYNAANINRPTVPVRNAEVGKDGTYSLTALVGENTVYVTGPGVPGQNDRGVVVKSGGDTIDIDLGSGERPKAPGEPPGLPKAHR